MDARVQLELSNLWNSIKGIARTTVVMIALVGIFKFVFWLATR